MAGVVEAVVEVVAHRGASRAAPENTVAAFRRAGAMGADAVELDVRRTADGVLVVHHNPHLPDGRVLGNVDHADVPSHVPTLAEALDACDGMWVNVEIKNDSGEPDFDSADTIADQTVAALAGRNEHGRWLISSFRLETIDRCRALEPRIRTAWLTDVAPPDVVQVIASRGHAAWHPWVGLLDKDAIDAAHRRRLRVNTWTCDDPERMAELVEWGIDGICTNVPDVALAVLGRTPGG